MKKSNESLKSSLIRGSKLALGAVGVIVLLVTAYHGINIYIDYRIENKINDLKFISKLSRSIRPSVVFDQKDSILANTGAMEYIENIDVIAKDGEPKKIVLSTKVFLGVAPLLECLDGDFDIIVNRGKKYDWEYELISIDRLLLSSSGQITNHRFRIEIIR